MTLQARPVELEHLSTLFRLTVKDEQQDQVSPNVFTLAEQAYEPGGAVWGLWDGDTAVGLMAMINPDESNDQYLRVNPKAAYLWRLLIDANHQGKGYGNQSVELAKAFARDWGMTHITLTFHDKPGGAEGFYLKNGFTRTGRIIDEELELIAPL